MKVKNELYDKDNKKDYGFLKHPKTIENFKIFQNKGLRLKKPNYIPVTVEKGLIRFLISEEVAIVKNKQSLFNLLKRANRSSSFLLLENEQQTALFVKALIGMAGLEKHSEAVKKAIKRGNKDEPLIQMFVGDESDEMIFLENIFNGSLSMKIDMGDKIKKTNVYNLEKITNKRNNTVDPKSIEDSFEKTLDDYYVIFNGYPKTYYSAGNMVKQGIASNKLDKVFDFLKFNDNEDFEKMFEMVCESVSGGTVETRSFGFIEKANTADISAAYLYELKNLEGLTGKCELVNEIKNDGNIYITRDKVKIPHGFDFSPITIRSNIDGTSNIRPTGTFYSTHTSEERDFVKDNGGEFENVDIIKIYTKKQDKGFVKLIENIEREKNNGNIFAKLLGNSLYGLSFEGHKNKNGAFDVGELFNPIITTLITSRTRLKMAKAGLEIEKNGGKVLQVLTDSFIWSGNLNDLPEKFWSEEKKAGMFEKPQKIKNVWLFGSGRYKYEDENGVVVSKTRGYESEKINWQEIVEKAKNENQLNTEIEIESTGTIGMWVQENLKLELLGEKYFKKRNMELLVGLNKRDIDDFEESDFYNGMVESFPIHAAVGVSRKRKDKIIDGTFGGVMDV